MANLMISTSQADPPQRYLYAPGSCSFRQRVKQWRHNKEPEEDSRRAWQRLEELQLFLLSLFFPVAASAELTTTKSNKGEGEEKVMQLHTPPLYLAAEADQKLPGDP